MATIGVYDADFFGYEGMMPNLESAKIITYYRKRREIAVLSPFLKPDRYTQFYIRKDIKDGRYPKAFFGDNCSYGGRAFESIKYSSLPQEIEEIIPDMHIYEPFAEFYSSNVKNAQANLKKILNQTHLRLQPNDNFILDTGHIIDHMKDTKSKGLILHDYNITSIPDAFERLREISNSRFFKSHPTDVNPYTISNKFPIYINNDTELYKWSSLPHLKGGFICCNYFRSDSKWMHYLENYDSSKLRIGYLIDKGCISEEQFLMQRLPQIYKQILYFWRHDQKFLLEYDTNFIRTKEIRDLIDFINFRFNMIYKRRTSLSDFCWCYAKSLIKSYEPKQFEVQELRDMFQYVRVRNYKFFKMLYEWCDVTYKDGEFVNE